MFMRRNGRFAGPIDQAIIAHPEIVDRCRYHKHARKWLERFAAGQLLVLRLETLQSNPALYRTKLFGYLGIAESIASTAVPERRQTAALPRSRLLARGTKGLAELARKAHLYRLIDWAKRSSLLDVLYRPLPGSYQQEHLRAVPHDVRMELEEEYSTFLATISRHGGVQVV